MTPLAAEYKDFYARELHRREELNGSIERPMAIITAIAGILYFCFQGLPDQLSLVVVTQICIGASVCFLLIMAVLKIVQSNYNHTYGYAPTPRALEDYRKSLTEHHGQHSELPKDKIEQAVLEYLYKAYAEAGHQNAMINDKRSEHLHLAKKQLIYALPATFILGFLRFLQSSQFNAWFSQLNTLVKGIAT